MIEDVPARTPGRRGKSTPVPTPANGRGRPAARPRTERGLLDRVLERWELERPPATLAGLDALHSAHITRVPFENATKIVKAQRAGSAESAMRGPVEYWEEHLRWGSGGTCFAATSAYQFLLRYLGFRSEVVFCHLPAHEPDAHIALLVETAEGQVLVDVGYALPAPLPLPSRTALRRKTPYYDLEIRRGPQDEYLVFSEDDRGQRFRYRFTPGATTEARFLAAWRKTFRPEAPYMRRLALGCFRDATRFLYKDAGRVFEITRAGEEARTLSEPLPESLSGLFGIPKPLLQAALAALEGPATPAPPSRR